jgi:hypothetical protein
MKTAGRIALVLEMQRYGLFTDRRLVNTSEGSVTARSRLIPSVFFAASGRAETCPLLHNVLY